MNADDTIETTKLLLVEDEPLVAIATAAMLKRNGYAVLRASAGEEAVERVASDREVALVLMDIDLGAGIDGTETARRILALRELPIVFLTSHTERNYVERAKEITRYGYVVKNSGEFVLISSIQMAFELFEANKTAQETMKALNANLKRHQAIARDLPGLVCRFTKDGITTFVNDYYCEYFGVAREEVLGASFLDLIPEHERYYVRDKFARLGAENPSIEYEHTAVDRNGEVRLQHWIDRAILDDRGEVVAYQSYGQDITERRSAEQKLQAEKEHFEHLFQSSPVAIVVVDENDVVIDCNTEFTRLFQFALEEAIGCELNHLIAPPDLLDEASNLSGQALSGAKVYCETRRRRKDGSEVEVAITGAPRLIDDEQYIYAIYQDITERKQVELRNTRLLEEKDLLLREVHHRIKNNMNTIGALLSLQVGLVTPEAAEALQDAESRVRVMQSVYDRLYRSSDFRSFPLPEYLDDLIEAARSATIHDNIAIKKDYGGCSCSFDAQTLVPLGLIVNELLTNALKHAFPHRREAGASTHLGPAENLGRDGTCPTVTVAIGACDSPERNTVRITVKDNGVGIGDSLTLERPSGFGLTIVRELADQIGAELQLERRSGTAFHLEVPVTRAASRPFKSESS